MGGDGTDARGRSRGAWTSNFGYIDGYMDRAERRFAGFRCGWEIHPPNLGETLRPYDMYCFKQDAHSAGKLETSWRATGMGVYLEQRGFQYTTNGPAFPRTSLLTGDSFYTYDGSGNYCSPCAASKATYTTHAYDSYGNRTQTVSYGDYYVGGDETTAVLDYFPNTSAYIVDRVARGQTFAGTVAGGTALSERRIYYDGSGSWATAPTQGYPTKVEDWLDYPTSRYVSTTTTYDAYGNPVQVTDPTNRSVTTTWDPTFHIFPETVANGAGETQTTAWDPICGVPLSTKAPNQQGTGYQTTFQTDALCRPSTTNFPLGGFETRTYLDFGNPNGQRGRVETPSGDGTGNDYVESHFDGFGRTWKTVKRGPPLQGDILTLTTFQPRSGVATRTETHYVGEAPRTAGYTYDSLNRVTETKLLPSTILSTVSYGLWSQTATDENGRSVTTRFDAYGRQKQGERSLGGGPVYTNYSYDLLGRLTGMSDHLGHAWSWTFDSLGRNTQKADPDAGMWNFQYDDGGRVTSQTDAKNQTITFTFDVAGSPATKTAPPPIEATTTTNYSESRASYFNVGFPTTITTPTSVLKLDYDAEGKLVKQTRTLDAAEYVLTRTYDSGGFLRGITYPDGDALGTLGYDAAGRLTLVPGIIASVTYDASGRPLVQTNANPTVTTRTYSPQRGFLTRIKTTPGTPPIQDLEYTLDTPGLVGLVSLVTSPHPNEGWSYGYDDLYRLTTSTNLSTPAESQTFQYDTIGRITYNSRVGSYTYPSVGLPRPHAPSTAGGNSYSYDLNGNMYSGAGRSLTWDANNQLSQAIVGSATTNFTYDADGDRLKKATPTSTISLYPLGDDDYEITGGVITKYFSMHGVSIAKKVGSGGGAQTFWLHTDRLGSVQAITDATGAVVQRRTYRPYGEKIADSSGHVESKGWINERHDGETGLTYLHARYYDAALGIFLSPDPVKPQLAYGYGAGNPISFTDRSGLDLEFPVEVNCPGDGPQYCPPGQEYPNGGHGEDEIECSPGDSNCQNGGNNGGDNNGGGSPPDCTLTNTCPAPDCSVTNTCPAPDCSVTNTCPAPKTPECKAGDLTCQGPLNLGLNETIEVRADAPPVRTAEVFIFGRVPPIIMMQRNLPYWGKFSSQRFNPAAQQPKATPPRPYVPKPPPPARPPTPTPEQIIDRMPPWLRWLMPWTPWMGDGSGVVPPIPDKCPQCA